MAQQSDLQGAQPYRLRARFRLLQPPGAPVEGMYTLSWVSPKEWREEISASGYNEVRVAANGGFWEANSAGRRSWPFRQLASTLNVKSHFRPDPARLREEAAPPGAQPGTRCLVLRGVESPSSSYCFTPGPAFARSEYGNEAYEYSQFLPWNSRSFPRAMSAWLNGERAVEVTVEELKELPPGGSEIFKPPAGAVEGCLSPEMPELLDSREPKYPAEAARTRTGGIVAVYVRVGTDGKVHDPFIIRTPGPEFDAPTLEALEQWKFRPASCSGRAVPFDTTIEVAFQAR